MACGLPLRDALSVERGIGPDCFKKYMGRSEGVSEGARSEANRIVHQLAIVISIQGPAAMGAALASESLLARLRELAFNKLADKLEKAHVKIKISEVDGMLVVVAPFDEGALAAQRAISGRRWDGAAKANRFPVAQRSAVWAMLRRFYAGMAGMGPLGAFVVPSEG